MDDTQAKMSPRSKEVLFSDRVVDRCNKLDQEDLDCRSVNGFKNKLDKIKKRKMSFSWLHLVRRYLGHGVVIPGK